MCENGYENTIWQYIKEVILTLIAPRIIKTENTGPIWRLNVCVCVPILVTTFPEWLSGTEPLPHTPGAVRPSSLCL